MKVELWENSGGGLFLVAGERAWSEIEHINDTHFADDARAIVNDQTYDWTVPEADIADVHKYAELIATYDDGQVTIERLPGRAASEYLGLAADGFTPAEAAALTNTAESTWRNKAAAGQVPGAVKKGKQWLIPRSWLKEQGYDV